MATRLALDSRERCRLNDGWLLIIINFAKISHHPSSSIVEAEVWRRVEMSLLDPTHVGINTCK
jgi:hypothetical protein